MPELKPSRSAKRSVKASRAQKKATKQQAKANRETTKKQIQAMAKAGTMKAANKPTSEQKAYNSRERMEVKKKAQDNAWNSRLSTTTDKKGYAKAIQSHKEASMSPDSPYNSLNRPRGKK